MNTMDMCYTRHLLSLVILSLHLYNHAIFYLGSIKSSVSTGYVSSLAIFSFCFFAILKEYFPQTITAILGAK